MKKFLPKKNKSGQKGVLFIALGYLVFFIVLVLFFAIILPATELFNIKVWASGDSIIQKADEAAAEINDTTMRDAFNDTIDAQKQAAIDNVDILGIFNQYSWAIIALIMLGVYFLYARQVVETQSGV